MNHLNRLEIIRLGVFIELACDADYQRLANGSSQCRPHHHRPSA